MSIKQVDEAAVNALVFRGTAKSTELAGALFALAIETFCTSEGGVDDIPVLEIEDHSEPGR
jgi:hypothetical protein